MDLITSDWKHVLRTETSKQFFLKTFYYNNKGTKKVKDFQKLSNKEIWKIKKPGLKPLRIGLRNELMDTYFLTPQYTE